MQLQIITIVASVSTVLAGGYINSCHSSGYDLRTNWITAVCADGRGGEKGTGVEVSRVLANYNGVLYWGRDGGAMQSCEGNEHRRFFGSLYTFRCNGQRRTCEMNDHITNVWGNMEYDGYQGPVWCYDIPLRGDGNETETLNETVTANGTPPPVKTAYTRKAPVTLTTAKLPAPTGKD